MFYPEFQRFPLHTNGMAQPYFPNFSMNTPFMPLFASTHHPFAPHFGTQPFSTGMSPGYASDPMVATISQKIDLLQSQIAFLTDCVRRAMNESTLRAPMYGTAPAFGVSPGYPTMAGSTSGGLPNYSAVAGMNNSDFCPGRMRESDSHIFWDLYLPNLVMSDVEVEVSGNRVICRTRVPVSPNARWWHMGVPVRGLEIFEMPDGRVEFNWVVPVPFLGRDVEASWRDQWISICIPKTETAQRQNVKVSKDASSARKGAAHELNA